MGEKFIEITLSPIVASNANMFLKLETVEGILRSKVDMTEHPEVLNC